MHKLTLVSDLSKVQALHEAGLLWEELIEGRRSAVSAPPEDALWEAGLLWCSTHDPDEDPYWVLDITEFVPPSEYAEGATLTESGAWQKDSFNGHGWGEYTYCTFAIQLEE